MCACHVSVRCVWATCGEPQGSSPSSFGAEGTRIEGELRLAFSSPAARAAQAWLLRVLRAQVSAARCWLAGSWLATACPPSPPNPTTHQSTRTYVLLVNTRLLACTHAHTNACTCTRTFRFLPMYTCTHAQTRVPTPPRVQTGQSGLGGCGGEGGKKMLLLGASRLCLCPEWSP